MSYEDQCKKWAAAKYNLDIDSITKVEMDIDHSKNYGSGCETCDYGGDCDLSIGITVRGSNNRILGCYEEYSWGFAKLLEEIINA